MNGFATQVYILQALSLAKQGPWPGNERPVPWQPLDIFRVWVKSVFICDDEESIWF